MKQLDEIFSARPMAHWREVFDKARLTYGLLRDPSYVIKDLQLRDFGTVVPLEVPAGNLTSTISRPMQVHVVAKLAAKRASELVEQTR